MNINSQPTLRATRLALRLGLCTAWAVGTFAATTQAQAVVVFANTAVAVPPNVDGLYLNLVTGATGSSAFAGWDINPYLTNTVFSLYWPDTPAASSGGVASAASGGTYTLLNPGDVVSSASTFSPSSGSTINFQGAGIHVLGLRFFNESTSAVNYGYMIINNGAAAGFPATILAWAYENSGAAITFAPAIPEPSTNAMWALGALALAARVRMNRPGSRGGPVRLTGPAEWASAADRG